MTPERSVWAVADGVATLFMCAATTARSRMLEHASPLIRLLAQRDAIYHDASLLERELSIFQAQRRRKPAHQRPHYSPAERAQILAVMTLRGWSAKEAGARFVVHPNTIRNWEKAIEDKLRSERLLGAPPWNRLHDGVRRLVHEIREVFPEPEFGTRTIARRLLRAGVVISRASVRRVLQEEPPNPSKQHPRVRMWHNRFRPHSAHGTLTPVEAERGGSALERVNYRHRGGVEPRIRLHRRCVRGDPQLAYPVIRVSECRLDAA